jgi:glycine/D-amino acid oxidase-like deaminating enzyme/nitrite reductase/ring-hydroxylating ferredoxin subunit
LERVRRAWGRFSEEAIIMKAVKASTDPLWLEDAALPELPRLDRNLKTDVCVVGAGMAGLSSAYILAKEGREVVVIDDGSVASGQTLCTTAHVSNVPDNRYAGIGRHGDERTRRVAEALSAALTKIESICDSERIDCDFRRVDAYLFLDPGDDQRTLDEELETAQRTGMIEVQRVPRAPLPSFDTGPCLRYGGQAQFQPIRYLIALTEAIGRRGGRVFNSTHATSIQGGSNACVDTHTGARIEANHIVVATNTPVNDRVAIHTKQSPYMTYVIAAAVPRDSIPLGLYWDTADPFHYCRLHRVHAREAPDNMIEGASHDFLLVGGEDHKTGQAHDGDERFARLELWARKRFPEMGSVERRWAGQVMESVDGLPFIGRNPLDYDNVYVATGFSGLGMTGGTLAGIILRDLILGRENPWAELYEPSRKVKTFASLREFAKENLNVAAQYSALLTPGEVDSADDIPPGEGAIVRRGIRKLAVYRGPGGELCEMSAICPHLKCVVQWNATEKTWDCPCHGSRFGPKGEVRNGPANTGLERL